MSDGPASPSWTQLALLVAAGSVVLGLLQVVVFVSSVGETSTSFGPPFFSWVFLVAKALTWQGPAIPITLGVALATLTRTSPRPWVFTLLAISAVELRPATETPPSVVYAVAMASIEAASLIAAGGLASWWAARRGPLGWLEVAALLPFTLMPFWVVLLSEEVWMGAVALVEVPLRFSFLLLPLATASLAISFLHPRWPAALGGGPVSAWAGVMAASLCGAVPWLLHLPLALLPTKLAGTVMSLVGYIYLPNVHIVACGLIVLLAVLWRGPAPDEPRRTAPRMALAYLAVCASTLTAASYQRGFPALYEHLWHDSYMPSGVWF